MAHFSRGTQEFKNDIKANTPYRVTVWINLKTSFNDSINRYEEMSAQQKADCEKMYEFMRQYGAQLSISFHERTNSDDVKDFPLAGRTTVYVNKQRQEQNKGALVQLINMPEKPTDQAAAEKFVSSQIDTGF